MSTTAPSHTTSEQLKAHDLEGDCIIENKATLGHATTNISISPELFEKLYSTPKVPHAAEKIGKHANAVPLAFLGFVIAAATYAMVLMGWGGAKGLSAVAGMFFFTGPLLLTLSTIFCWISGDFFAMMVSALFSVYWLSFGLLQLPTLDLAAAYSATGNAAEGAASKEMNAVLALYCLVWGFALATFTIFTLRINLVFVGIFGFTSVACWLQCAAYFAVGNVHYSKASTLLKAAGALLFVVSLLGWYMLVVIMAAEMRWSVNFPVGDLSRYWASTDVELAAMENGKKD